MSRTHVLVVVPMVVLGVLGLGGCRGADRAALPTPQPAPQSAAVPRFAASAADPLAGIESSVDAVERDVDADSRADAGSADGAGPRSRAGARSDSSAGR
jgi:hypothetical protein